MEGAYGSGCLAGLGIWSGPPLPRCLHHFPLHHDCQLPPCPFPLARSNSCEVRSAIFPGPSVIKTSYPLPEPMSESKTLAKELRCSIETWLSTGHRNYKSLKLTHKPYQLELTVEGPGVDGYSDIPNQKVTSGCTCAWFLVNELKVPAEKATWVATWDLSALAKALEQLKQKEPLSAYQCETLLHFARDMMRKDLPGAALKLLQMLPEPHRIMLLRHAFRHPSPKRDWDVRLGDIMKHMDNETWWQLKVMLIEARYVAQYAEKSGQLQRGLQEMTDICTSMNVGPDVQPSLERQEKLEDYVAAFMAEKHTATSSDSDASRSD